MEDEVACVVWFCLRFSYKVVQKTIVVTIKTAIQQLSIKSTHFEGKSSTTVTLQNNFIFIVRLPTVSLQLKSTILLLRNPSLTFILCRFMKEI